MFLLKKGNSLIKKEKKGNSLCHYDLWERQKRRRKKQKKGHYLRLGQISSCLLMIQKLDFYYPPHDFYR